MGQHTSSAAASKSPIQHSLRSLTLPIMLGLLVLTTIVMLILAMFKVAAFFDFHALGFQLLLIFLLIVNLNLLMVLFHQSPVATGQEKQSRRKFITLSSSYAKNSAMGGVRQKMTAGIAAVTKKRNPKSKNPIIPAGATDFAQYKQMCNVCQACVEACPTKVLRPSLSLENLMLPELNFNDNACLLDCVKCNEACPTGALRPLTAEEKTDIQIGYAVWLRENCIVIEGKECAACETACPNGSLQLIQSGRFRIPIINTGRCLGCGACQAACPASPLKAIFIEGHKSHRQS